MENFDTLIAFSIFGIPINYTIFSSWIVIGFLGVLSFWATLGLKNQIKVSKLQTFLEMIVMFLHDEIEETANDNPKKYLWLVTGLFFFIATSNLMTIWPWFKPPTASLSTTVAFGFIVFLAIPYYAIKNAGLKGYLKKFIDPTPLMLPMNVFSDIASTFAMAFRLYGNMLSGVMFATILTTFVPFLLPLPMQGLGLLTGTIQAYIFALLAIVYTSNVAPEVPYQSKKTMFILEGEK